MQHERNEEKNKTENNRTVEQLKRKQISILCHDFVKKQEMRFLTD